MLSILLNPLGFLLGGRSVSRLSDVLDAEVTTPESKPDERVDTSVTSLLISLSVCVSTS